MFVIKNLYKNNNVLDKMYVQFKDLKINLFFKCNFNILIDIKIFDY